MYLYNDEFSNAIRTFNIILTYEEKNPDALFFRGYAKMQLSDYHGAIEDFSFSIESDQYYTQALYYRAICHIELNDFKYALNDLVDAIDIDDRHDYYYVARGYLHTEFGDTLGAIKDYEKALKLNPENESALLNMGQLYLSKKDYKKALEYADKLIAENPKNEQAFLLSGNIKQYQKEYPEAIERYQHVISLDSNNIRAFFFLGLCMHETKNYDTAYLYYNKAEKLNPNNSVIYYHRALLNMETEKYQDALSDLNKVITRNSKNIYSYHLRGIVKIYMEDFAGAEKDFTKAIELYPFMADAYRNRAYTRGMQNKIQGYYADKAFMDSLFVMGEDVVDNIDLDYYKSITDFSADFNMAEAENSGKLQYVEQSIRMISIYHPVLVDTLTLKEPYVPIQGLDFNEINVTLKMDNYDYSEINEFTIADLKEKIDLAMADNSDNMQYELLKSIVLSWLMDYNFAHTVLDSLESEAMENSIYYFLLGNYDYFIGSVMASLEIRQFKLEQETGFDLNSNDNEKVNKKYEEAVEQYDQAIKLNPDNLYTYYNRAYVNANLKNYNKAIEDYTYCIEHSDEFADALYNRGLIRLYLNQYTLGCKDLSLAGEKGIDNAYRVIYKYCKN